MDAQGRFQTTPVVLHPGAEVLVGGVDILDPLLDGWGVRVAFVDQGVGKLQQQLDLFSRFFGLFLKKGPRLN